MKGGETLKPGIEGKAVIGRDLEQVPSARQLAPLSSAGSA